jgi:acyl-CoA reductase-like NAD-dependent aldehyde dehydrogenase
VRELAGFFIDGRLTPPASSETRELVSPSKGEAYGQIPVATGADVDRAVGAARAAFVDGRWSRIPVAERATILNRAADLLEARVDEIAETNAIESGTPFASARLIAQDAAKGIRRATRIALTAQWEEERQGAWDYVLRHEPVGVVGVISPWNGSPWLTTTRAANALAAGCTVVDKPAVEVPFSAIIVADAFAAAGLPPGAFNCVPGDRDAGEALVRHALVDMVAFTGSTLAGRQIAAICGADLKRALLELGGKSAAIVLDDADLATLTRAVASGTFSRCGQQCIALTRVLAPRGRYDEIVDELAAEAERWPAGDPLEPTCVRGPLISQAHRERVEAHVRSAEAEGAVIVTGGSRPEGREDGFYFDPTVVRDVTPTMRIAKEEIFGPVVAVIAYDSVDEAIRIANDSEYGLHGAVFTADIGRAMEIAAQIQTGTFTINGFTMNSDAPLGGVKGSGIGRMGALEGFDEYRILKTVNLRPTEQQFDTYIVR